MASTPEKKVKDKVVAILKDEGVYFFKPPANGYGRSGIPDIVVCANGLFVGIECKANGNKPTDLQVREIETIRRNNGVAVVVDETNWEMIRPLIRKLKATSIILPEGAV